MADVLMYYNDVMLCYGISAEELKQSYFPSFGDKVEKLRAYKCKKRDYSCIFSSFVLKVLKKKCSTTANMNLCEFLSYSTIYWWRLLELQDGQFFRQSVAVSAERCGSFSVKVWQKFRESWAVNPVFAMVSHFRFIDKIMHKFTCQTDVNLCILFTKIKISEKFFAKKGKKSASKTLI